MPAHLQDRLLHSSPTVRIYDVRCRPHSPECGPEECSRVNNIVFPRAGVFLKRIHRTNLVADPNHVLFFRRHEPYRVAHPAGSGDDCTVFAFDPGSLAEAVAVYRPAIESQPDQPFEFTHVLSGQRLFLFHQRLRQRALSAGKDGLTLDELALELLAAVIGETYEQRGIAIAPRRAATLQAHRELAERTCLLLAARLAENLGLAEIARLVFCSAFHLARLFRGETGLPIHQYRNRLRLRAALERIVAGEADLSALALDVGFSSHSHLTSLFRSAFGLTPSECRRQATSRLLREMSKNLKARPNA